MYALCLRYAGSPDDAQDVLQNGFIKMFRKLDDFRGEGSFEGWLRRIMVTSAIEYCRKNASLQQQQSITETLSERLNDEQPVLDRLHAEELAALNGQRYQGCRAETQLLGIEG